MPRLLIADDHPLFRLALVQALREVVPGSEVLEAGSLAQARERLDAEADIDLILLDLHMPDSHGLMGLTALRSEHPGIAVVMISAHDDTHTIRRALAYGQAFIPKRTDVKAGARPCARYCRGSYLRPIARSGAGELASSQDRLRLRAGQPHAAAVQGAGRVAEGDSQQIADTLAFRCARSGTPDHSVREARRTQPNQQRHFASLNWRPGTTHCTGVNGAIDQLGIAGRA